VKSEELFVVFDRLADLLEQSGIQLVDPQVGEFCTSFDMAGVSLTLLWLDDELERFWLAAADTPAFRTGSIDPGALVTVATSGETETDRVIPESSAESRAAAQRVVALIAAARDVIDENADELGRIDAIAGDGDHGIGMQRGARAAAAAAAGVAAAGAGAATVLSEAGDAWSDRAGGTSGALWGVILNTVGRAVGDTDALTPASVSAGVTAATSAVMEYGKAKVGDKTMVDALVPFAETLAAEVADGTRLPDAWGAAATAATRAADATKDLMPGMGRARSHGDKALGVPDPGAVSLALIVERLHDVLAADATDET
jgi:dihydroxyacetone kinase